MGLMVLKQPYVSINSVDLSAFVKSISLPYEMDTVESTAGNATGSKSYITALYGWSLEIEANQDYAAAQVDATLWAAMVAGAAVPIEVRPSTAVVGATNPKWTGNAIITGYDPFGGAKVGDLITAKPSITGTGALTRAVA
jgi:hypothetical protein